MEEDTKRPCQEEQTHVHEFLGSTKSAAEPGEEPHNHRFAGVSFEVIRVGDHHHIHEVKARTDFFEDHFHIIWERSKREIFVDDKHVHFVTGTTNEVEDHTHDFVFATLIEDPIG